MQHHLTKGLFHSQIVTCSCFRWCNTFKWYSITRDLTVGRNLVVNGTASFVHREDFDVADKFIRLNSGSTTVGDGIVVQQTSDANGEVFAYDSGLTRWGVTSSFDASTEVFTPDAFISLVGTSGNATPNLASRYQKVGNIFVSSNDESIDLFIIEYNSKWV